MRNLELAREKFNSIVSKIDVNKIAEKINSESEIKKILWVQHLKIQTEITKYTNKNVFFSSQNWTEVKDILEIG